MAEQEQGRGLTDEERAEAKAEIDEWLRRRAEIPEEERHPMPNPDKFAGPIGADAEGNVVTEDAD